MALAIAGIVAAYTRKDQDPPLTADDILYDAKPTERNDLITAIIELRNEWYDVPSVVAETVRKESQAQEDDDKQKN